MTTKIVHWKEYLLTYIYFLFFRFNFTKFILYEFISFWNLETLLRENCCSKFYLNTNKKVNKIINRNIYFLFKWHALNKNLVQSILYFYFIFIFISAVRYVGNHQLCEKLTLVPKILIHQRIFYLHLLTERKLILLSNYRAHLFSYLI